MKDYDNRFMSMSMSCLLLQAVPFCCASPALNSRLVLGKPEGNSLLPQPFSLPLRQGHLAPQRICFCSRPLQAHGLVRCQHALQIASPGLTLTDPHLLVPVSPGKAGLLTGRMCIQTMHSDELLPERFSNRVRAPGKRLSCSSRGRSHDQLALTKNLRHFCRLSCCRFDVSSTGKTREEATVWCRCHDTRPSADSSDDDGARARPIAMLD